MRQSRSILNALAVLAFTFLPLTAGAQSDPPAWLDKTSAPRVELFLSSLFASSAQEGSFGLRGGFSLGRRFALEGNLSRVTGDRVDLHLVDVSAKYYLTNGWRTDFYVAGGPGFFLSDDLDAEEPMIHLGLGAEIDLGRRFYLRPDLRGRWFVDALDATNILDLSVGFGWRF